MEDNAEGAARRRAKAPDLLGLGRRLLGRSAASIRLHEELGTGIVDCAVYKNGVREEVTDIDAALVEVREDRDKFLWLGLHEPTADELIAVAQRFDLHPLAVEDAIHAHQRPKLEQFGNTFFAILKPGRYVDPKEVIEIGETLVFVSPDFLISVRYGQAAELHLARKHLEEHPEVLKMGTPAAFWAIADTIVDGYELALDGVSNDIDEIEEAVFNPEAKSSTERVYRLKREILEFRRVIEPLSEALDPLVDGSISFVGADIIPYFRDVDDHLSRAQSRVTAFDQLLSDVLQANVTLVTLQQNNDMRRITAWAGILAVNTTIAGIYGMNFKNIPETHWHYGYYECLGLMLVLSVILYISFKRQEWL